MTVEQLPVLVAKLVENQTAFLKLPKDDAQWVIEKPREAIALIVEAFRRRRVEAPRPAKGGSKAVAKAALLKFVRKIVVPALPGFKVSELFVVDTSETARVKVSFVGSNFISWFGEMIVGMHSGSTLSYHTLTRNAYDRDIIAELGGEERGETNLAEILWLMNQQKNGVLLTNGYANIFYVRDRASALRAVYVYWSVRGWRVSARELDYHYWREFRRVFVPSASSSVGSYC